MKTVIIDFTGVDDIRMIEEIIKASFLSMDVGFPEFYGKNPNALWDCLTGFIERPIEIRLKGTKGIARHLKWYIEIILNTFEDAENDKRLGIYSYLT